MMKKFRFTALVLTLMLMVTAIPAALAAEEGVAETVSAFCDGTAGYKLVPEERDAGYEGEFFFAKYFGDDVPAGVEALVAAGGVSVNGATVPAQDEAGKYVMEVNGSNKLSADVDDSNVAPAVVNALGDLLKASGTQVTLTLDGGAVTQMDLFYTAGILVDHTEEQDGKLVAYTGRDSVFTVGGGMGPMGGGAMGPVGGDNAPADEGNGASQADMPPADEGAGAPQADMAPTAEPITVEFDPENVVDVTDGCIAVYWEAPDGWHLQGADSMKGYLTDGADHQYYVLEDEAGNAVQYVDAEMYSREFSDGNRPGQFTNTQLNFELSDIEVTVWFIPGTLDTDNPMPIGITGLENAATRLERAIAYTQNVLDKTVIAGSKEDAAAQAEADGLGEDYHWIPETVTSAHVSGITGNDAPGMLDMLNEKLAQAQALLDAGEASSAEYDQEAYELFIAMWGSSSDIGAVFMGNAQEGYFDVADAGAHALPAAVLK